MVAGGLDLGDVFLGDGGMIQGLVAFCVVEGCASCIVHDDPSIDVVVGTLSVRWLHNFGH